MVNQALANEFAEHLGFSGYGGEVRVAGRTLVMTTDGVGTKLLVAEHFGKYDTIGIDLVAMCANDLLCCGAKPLAFMDYYATGDLDLNKSKEILVGINKGCEIAGCTLTGGETAQLNPMFKKKHWFDLAGFMIGVQKKPPTPHYINTGDYLVGIPSSGVHSNGFTDLRMGTSSWDMDWMIPTRIYTKEILNNINYIKACAHITGGGVHGNLPRVLGGKKYDVDLTLGPWWKELRGILGMTLDEFEAIFNCGWGMIVVTANPNKLNIEDAKVIGRIL
jgi:phosphoribosylformylglycinamidine cyclo-ligase